MAATNVQLKEHQAARRPSKNPEGNQLPVVTRRWGEITSDEPLPANACTYDYHCAPLHCAANYDAVIRPHQ